MVDQEIQYNLPNTLSLAATRIYLSVDHEVFAHNETQYNLLGLTKEEYEQGITEIVASGCVAFRLVSPMYGDMASELSQKAYECICGMSGITDKYIQRVDGDRYVKYASAEVLDSMTEQDRARYIELDQQRLRYCLDAEQMLVRQSEELTGNKAPEHNEPIPGTNMWIPRYASGFIPNVRIIDGDSYMERLRSLSYSHYNIGGGLRSTTDNNGVANSPLRFELSSVSVECNGTDAHKLDSLLVSLEPTGDRSPSGLTAFSDQKRATSTQHKCNIDATQMQQSRNTAIVDGTLHENNQKPTEDSQGSSFGLVSVKKDATQMQQNATNTQHRTTIWRRKQKQERIEQERSRLFNLVYEMKPECAEIDGKDSSGSIHDDYSPFAIRRSFQIDKIIQVYSILHTNERPLTPDMAKSYLSHNDNSCWNVVYAMLDMWEYLEAHQREDGSKHNYPTYYRQVFINRSNQE